MSLEREFFPSREGKRVIVTFLSRCVDQSLLYRTNTGGQRAVKQSPDHAVSIINRRCQRHGSLALLHNSQGSRCGSTLVQNSITTLKSNEIECLHSLGPLGEGEL